MAAPQTVLVGAVSAQASVSIAQFGLPAIGPELQAEYGLSLAGLGAVLTANLLGSGLALLPAGVIVDRYGSRLPLAVGTGLGAAGLAAAAFAPSTAVLLVALLVAGLGSAFVPIAGFGALMRAFGPARRGFALGVRQMAVPLGGMLAAIVLPLLDRAGGVELALTVCAGLLLVFGSGVRASSPREVRLPTCGRASRCTGWCARPACRASSWSRRSTSSLLQSALAFTVPSVRDSGFSAFVAGAIVLRAQRDRGGRADRVGPDRRPRRGHARVRDRSSTRG